MGSLDLLRGECLALEIVDFEWAAGVGGWSGLGDVDGGEIDLDGLVHIPILLLNGVRVMGVRQGKGHAEGTS